jgi:hypothetical protein
MRADVRLLGLLVLHELDVMARRPALRAIIALHVGLLAMFLVAWGDGRGVPLLAPRSIYEQLRLIQVPLLALLLPWVAARSLDERRDDFVRLSAVTGLRPSLLLGAKAIALVVSLTAVALAGLPVAMIASRMSVAEAGALMMDEAATAGIALAAGSACLISCVAARGRVAGWAGATLAVLSIVFAALNTTTSPAAAGVVAAAAGLPAMALLIGLADSRLRYLSEAPA